jgi:hypothetical protein
MHKYWESKTTRIMMATVRHVTSSSGLRKFQAAWFLLNRGYISFVLAVHIICVAVPIICVAAIQIQEILFFPICASWGAQPLSLLLKGPRDVYLWGQVASVQLTTCFSLVSKLRIGGAVPHFPTHLHEMQKDNFICIFNLDIRAETSVGQVSVTVSYCQLL